MMAIDLGFRRKAAPALTSRQSTRPATIDSGGRNMGGRVTYDRSAVMRAVKSRDTGPERAVRALLRAIAPGYRLHRADLPGKPDVVYVRRKLAIFVHGCFWHGHDCARGARAPKANAAYWRAKIARNRARDAKTLAAYPLMGWRAVVVYECELKDKAALSARLAAALRPEHGWRSRAPLGDG
jgi:DNA mismatch endonuclease (patch repair protein)